MQKTSDGPASPVVTSTTAIEIEKDHMTTWYPAMRLVALLNGEKKRSVTTSSDTTKYQHSEASRVTWVTNARFVQVEALNSRRRPSFELRNRWAIINCAAKTKLQADR